MVMKRVDVTEKIKFVPRIGEGILNSLIFLDTAFGKHRTTMAVMNIIGIMLSKTTYAKG
jgi:hypothetical protein